MVSDAIAVGRPASASVSVVVSPGTGSKDPVPDASLMLPGMGRREPEEPSVPFWLRPGGVRRVLLPAPPVGWAMPPEGREDRVASN